MTTLDWVYCSILEETYKNEFILQKGRKFELMQGINIKENVVNEYYVPSCFTTVTIKQYH